jgi:glycosyltransferase involved in cell wall biosynthesis
MSEIVVAVDASRIRSGGGVAHLIGILSVDQIDIFGFKEIHVWSYQKLLDAIPNRPWLYKHYVAESERSIITQLRWQADKLPQEIRAHGCDILFSADAGTVCRFEPMIVLNQNMLPYDDGVLRLFGWSRDRIQQKIIYYVQKRAFLSATASVFLTQHAADQVQRHTGKLKRTRIIPHGVGQIFKDTRHRDVWPQGISAPIRCLYVSPILEYKYQWVVVRAIEVLRDRGHNLALTLVGGGGRRAKKMLDRQLNISDPKREFVQVLEFLPHVEIPEYIANTNIFIFASGCETFGISLLEAMAVGAPIASSNRSSLPETLKDGGVYFDPSDHLSIAQSIQELIDQPNLRAEIAKRATNISRQYSWERCADETWRYVSQIYKDYGTADQVKKSNIAF